jgi:hypothetical protein
MASEAKGLNAKVVASAVRSYAGQSYALTFGESIDLVRALVEQETARLREENGALTAAARAVISSSGMSPEDADNLRAVLERQKAAKDGP